MAAFSNSTDRPINAQPDRVLDASGLGHHVHPHASYGPLSDLPDPGASRCARLIASPPIRTDIDTEL
jgi:hypothetical protein